ncbi:hypothetical protein GCM10027068_48240 [Prescottella soli]
MRRSVCPTRQFRALLKRDCTRAVKLLWLPIRRGQQLFDIHRADTILESSQNPVSGEMRARRTSLRGTEGHGRCQMALYEQDLVAGHRGGEVRAYGTDAETQKDQAKLNGSGALRSPPSWAITV